MSKIPTFQDVKRVQIAKGNPIFEGDYNVTLGGIRTNIGGSTGQSKQTDKFDDWIWCIRTVKGKQEFVIVPATTDPGLYYLKNPINSKGTAILDFGFHGQLWKKGNHSRITNAFRQNKPCTVIRDRDRDNYLDMGPNVSRETGMFWINLHPATYRVGGRSYNAIGRWGAGCQVTQTWKDFAQLRDIRDDQLKHFGSSITSYSLHSIVDY